MAREVLACRPRPALRPTRIEFDEHSDWPHVTLPLRGGVGRPLLGRTLSVILIFRGLPSEPTTQRQSA